MSRLLVIGTSCDVMHVWYQICVTLSFTKSECIHWACRPQIWRIRTVNSCLPERKFWWPSVHQYSLKKKHFSCYDSTLGIQMTWYLIFNIQSNWHGFDTVSIYYAGQGKIWTYNFTNINKVYYRLVATGFKRLVVGSRVYMFVN